MKDTDNISKFLILEFLQKFYAQILFVPLLLGGISQLISLLLISPNSVRFFSPSQAISDGLFFLTILILFIIASLIVTFFIILYGTATLKKPEGENEKSCDKIKPRNKLSHEVMPTWLHLILFPIVIYCYYILFKFLPDTLRSNNNPNALDILGLAPFAFMFNFGASIFLMRFIFINKEYYFLENKNTFYFLNLLLCLICLMIFNIFSTRNTNFASNFEKLKNKYCCENQGIVEILYFNDKYIFIERSCENSKELIIAKFEELFPNEK